MTTHKDIGNYKDKSHRFTD